MGWGSWQSCTRGKSCKERTPLVTIVHSCSREKPLSLLPPLHSLSSPSIPSFSLSSQTPAPLDSSEIESKTRDVHHVGLPQQWKAAHFTFPSHLQENLQEIYRKLSRNWKTQDSPGTEKQPIPPSLLFHCLILLVQCSRSCKKTPFRGWTISSEHEEEDFKFLSFFEDKYGKRVGWVDG